MTISTGVYVKNSVEAANLYMKAFGLELGYHVRNEDGSFFHSDLVKDGKPVISVVEGKGSDDESIVQLGLAFDSPEEVRRVYDIFVEDGAKIDFPIGELPWSKCAASVVDRFGVWWYFTI